jgi:hypothetical protein
LSEQRYNISDARRIESGVRNDFDTMVTAMWTNTSQGYIIRGFNILVAGAIGAPANGLQLVVDPGAVININASVSGTIFQTPTGTPNQTLNAATNTNVSGSFAPNSTNYVGIDYNRFADPTTDETKYIWSQSANDEIETIAPAAQTLTFKLYITTSVWALNVLPIAIVVTDSNGNVTSISDCRWMLYSLETGGLNPNPNYVYPWSEGRTQSPVTVSSANSSSDPFSGGDKQLTCAKDWENAVMSMFLEVKGTPYWFSGPTGPGPNPSIANLFQDLGNTVVTGAGEISNGILPNSDAILTTTGNLTASSNLITSVASTVGLSDGDYIFGTGIPQFTRILNISGSTITMNQEATLPITSASITFYSPSVITTPGQINWDQNIELRVIGSSLTYTLVANPSSSDITLSDDEAAYITLVRDVVIAPNLIFVSGSPDVTSVGSVSWTAGLLAGDYIKVASNTSAGYYQILSLGTAAMSYTDSAYAVTLTTNVVPADNSGVTGSQAKYAFGTYNAVPTPSTNRDIYIAARAAVPMSGNTFWLFLREDNGGNPRVYVRFLGQELDNGESVEVSGTTSLELLQYIGSPSSSSSQPQYVDAIDPNSIPQITAITVGAGSTITTGQYFLLNSSADSRQYAVWFNVSGGGGQPVVADVTNYIEVDVLSGDSANTIATKLATALNSEAGGDFSAVAGTGTVTVTTTSAGTSNPASNGNVGAPFAVSTTQLGTGQGNYIIHDSDNLTLAIKELDTAYGELIASLDSPTYDEIINVVASGGTYPPSLNSPVSINGPVANGSTITLPNNSRESNIPAQYTVGKGTLQVFLNGQFLDIETGAYQELGIANAPSSTIEILALPGGGLVVGDSLEFRIGLGGGGGGGSSSIGPAGPQGPQGINGFDAAGGPVPVSIKTGNYTVLTTDCFLAADCTSGPITFTLFPASGNTGRIVYLKKIDSSSNALTIVGNGSDTVEFGSSFVENIQGQSVSLISNGSTGWWAF